VVKPSYGLSDDQIAKMLQEGFSTAEQDMKARALAEARVEAERMQLATRSALAADGQLLDPQERSEIESLLVALQRAVDSSDAATIDADIKAVAQGTEAFAARRMNEGIRRALAGKNLESL
jgi:molecular chaperone HscA